MSPELPSEFLATLQSILSKKQSIGYTWELMVQQSLSKSGIMHIANPLNPDVWKRETKDRPIDIETVTLDIECKYNNTKVYPAWIRKNILKRFLSRSDRKRKIVLTNNKMNYYHHPENKKTLKDNNIELWDIEDLEYYLKTPSYISIYNFIKSNVDGIILVSVKSIEYLIIHMKSLINLRNIGSTRRIYKAEGRLSSDFAVLENDSLNDSNIVGILTLKTFKLVLLMEQIGKTLMEYLRLHQTDIDQFLEKASKIKTGPMKKVQWKQNSTWSYVRPWSSARPWLINQPWLNIQSC